MVTDDFTPQLARHLTDMDAGGLDPAAPLNQALMIDPLPDDHAAAALWWRIQSQLTPVEIHLNTPSEDFAHQRPLSGAAHDR